MSVLMWIGQSGEDSGIDVSPDVKAEYLFSDSYVLYLHALGGL